MIQLFHWLETNRLCSHYYRYCLKCLLLPATRRGVVCLCENRMCIRQTPDCLYTLTLVQDLRLHNLGFFFFFFFSCIMEEFQPVATHHS